MREKTSMMPPARASAPPERPVPAPRPTMGMLILAASLTMCGDFRGGGGKNDRSGRPFSTEPSYS